MRKKIFSLFLVLLLLVQLSFILISCDGSSNDSGGSNGDNTTNEHTHTFNQQIATSKYLVSSATCSSKAKYYYSCSCGEKGNKTFEYGELNSSNHSGALKWVTTDTTHKQQYNCCGKVVVEEASHTGGEATTTSKAVCEICGKSYGELLEEVKTVDTVSELISTYPTETQEFLNLVCKQTLSDCNISEDDVTFASWDYSNLDGDNIADSIKLYLSYKNSNGTETMNVWTYSLASEITLDEIANISSTSSAISRQLKTDLGFNDLKTTFASREAWLRDDLVSALLAKVNAQGAEKVFFTSSTTSSKTVFSIMTYGDNTLSAYTFTFDGSYENDSDYIANISDATIQKMSPTTLQTPFVSPVELTYTIETASEAVTYFSSEINNALESVIDGYFTEYNLTGSTINSYKWDIGEVDSDGNVEYLNVYLNYVKSNGSGVCKIIKCTPKTTLTLEDLTDSSVIKNLSFEYSLLYSTGYVISLQQDSDAIALAKVIAEKNITDIDLNDESVKYYVINKGASTNATLGTTIVINVIVVSNEGLRHTSTSIQQASGYTALIEKVNNNKSSTSLTGSYDFSENALEEVEIATEE